eukprot:97088_1
MSNAIGSVLTKSCLEGYHFDTKDDNPTEATCTSAANGYDALTLKNCIPIILCERNTLTTLNSFTKFEEKTVDATGGVSNAIGSVLNVVCDKGCEFAPSGAAPLSTTCEAGAQPDTAEYSEKNLKQCIRQENFCVRPAIDDSKAEFTETIVDRMSNAIGSVLTKSCLEGYHFDTKDDNPTEATCTSAANGYDALTLKNCIPKVGYCHQPNQPAHTIVMSVSSCIDGQIEYSCEDGYERSSRFGELIRTCFRGNAGIGYFSGVAPVCSPKAG